MQEGLQIQSRVDELRKEISLMEWDIPNMKNAGLKSAKEQKLKQSKKELQDLLEKLKIISNNAV